MSKFGSLSVFAGLAMMGLSSALFVVDPGEKALIMDKVNGLQ